MFAGRYLWWLMIGLAGFWFATVYFDHVASTAVFVSGCERAVGSCGEIAARLSGTVKPFGLYAVAGIILGASLARIHYLRLSLLWAAAMVVWLMASVPFLLLFNQLWAGNLNYYAIRNLMPVSLPFLLAFGLFLVFPVEEYDSKTSRPISKFQRAASYAAAYSVVSALSVEPQLGAMIARLTGLEVMDTLISTLQPPLAVLLRLGTEGYVLSACAFLVFALGLAVSLGWHTRLGAVAPKRRTRQSAIIDRPCSR